MQYSRYQIQSTVVHKVGNASTTYQLPTFYLDTNVQGIVSEDHACQVAKRILNPANLDCLEIHVNAYGFNP